MKERERKTPKIIKNQCDFTDFDRRYRNYHHGNHRHYVPRINEDGNCGDFQSNRNSPNFRNIKQWRGNVKHEK